MRSSYCGVSALSRNRKARIELLRTLELILAIGAALALAAHTGYPFDANTITLFPQISHIVAITTRPAPSWPEMPIALLYLAASACIFILEEASVEPTNTAVVDLAKDLAGSRVWDGDSCDLAFSGVAYHVCSSRLFDERGDAWLVVWR